MPQSFSDPTTGGSQGELRRSQQAARRQRATEPLTAPAYQPGEAKTSADGLGITRRQLTAAGQERLQASQGLSGGLDARRQLIDEQRADRQTEASAGKLFQEHRQARRAARGSEKSRGPLGQAIGETARKTASAELLKQAWLNLIDSIGLTFLYIFFHFCARYIAGSQSFCAFGEEWFIAPSSGMKSAAKAGTTGSAKAAAKNRAKDSVSSSQGGGDDSATLLELASKPVEVAELVVFGLLAILLMIALAAPLVGLLSIGWFWLEVASVIS
ncbi:MAG: hypothetical protein AAB817_03035 [Patescibacteria group bacterium]